MSRIGRSSSVRPLLERLRKSSRTIESGIRTWFTSSAACTLAPADRSRRLAPSARPSRPTPPSASGYSKTLASIPYGPCRPSRRSRKRTHWRRVTSEIERAGSRAGDGTRTRDHLLGRQALYQLSYSRVGPYSIPRQRRGLRPVVDPGFPFRVHLFLPDRHRVLQLIDQPFAGVERFSPMRSRDGDHHTDLAHMQRAGSVGDRQIQNRPALASLVRDVLHLLDSHRTVGFVHQGAYLLAP